AKREAARPTREDVLVRGRNPERPAPVDACPDVALPSAEVDPETLSSEAPFPLCKDRRPWNGAEQQHVRVRPAPEQRQPEDRSLIGSVLSEADCIWRSETSPRN